MQNKREDGVFLCDYTREPGFSAQGHRGDTPWGLEFDSTGLDSLARLRESGRQPAG